MLVKGPHATNPLIRILTWEDAFYDNHTRGDPEECKQCDDLHYGHDSHDLLSLALAKLSCHVFSLGEGYETIQTIGQVAVTGNHMWIFGNSHVTDSCSSVKCCEGWKTQFSAGIKTIAVVAVVPIGVVQLGSLKTIAEDLKLVDHVREIFFDLQSRLIDPTSSVLPCSVECFPSLSAVATSSVMGNIPDFVSKRGRNMEKTSTTFQSSTFSSLEPGESSHAVEPRGSCPSKTARMSENNGVPEEAVSMFFNSLSVEEFFNTMQKHINVEVVNDQKCGEVPSRSVDREIRPSSIQIIKSEENMEFQGERYRTDALMASFQFLADCELYEALGPAFCKQRKCCDVETGKEDEAAIVVPVEELSSSNLYTTNSSSEHLLQAVVANVCHSDNVEKIAEPISRSLQSLKTTEELVDPSFCNFPPSNSTCFSFQSGSSQVFSSTNPSRSSDQPEKLQELAKLNRKRARNGENSRPRPKDRQLIQDRIKELRELVPNGSKCSIDALLERTIKHMLFMQCVAKNSRKIDNYSESKLLGKETGGRGCYRYELGSSWAVDVESQMKICPIIVENIDPNGQMLVEMFCKESVHFLEIAEAIRGLGLTILKGVTEVRDDNTWIWFVVEGQNDRSVHRIDVLWSLVQILKSKTST